MWPATLPTTCPPSRGHAGQRDALCHVAARQRAPQASGDVLARGVTEMRPSMVLRQGAPRGRKTKILGGERGRRWHADALSQLPTPTRARRKRREGVPPSRHSPPICRLSPVSCVLCPATQPPLSRGCVVCGSHSVPEHHPSGARRDGRPSGQARDS